jgi:ribosomal protein S18 acetylase RimI-like enzyme
MIYRRATTNDIQILTEMNINLRFDERIDNEMSYQEIKERMEGFLNNSEYSIELMEDQENIVGYYLLNESKNPMYLRQLYIKKEYRNQGCGRKTIDHIMEEKNIKKIDIDVMIWNTDAIAFYERCGFQERYISMRLSR